MTKEQDTTHSILRSARRFLGGTLLSRFSGLLRDVSMAFAFGTQEAIAAFLVAFRFAHLLRRLFGEGALQTAFIPHFEQLRVGSPERANRFFCNLVALLSVGLTAFILLMMLLLGAILWWGNLSQGNHEILFLTLLLMPSLLFICLFGINASLLQCEKRYFIAGVAPVAFNVIWGLGVLSLWRLKSSEAMPWLSAWVIIACLCQWLATVPQVFRLVKQHLGDRLWRGIELFSEDVRKLARPLFLGMIGVAASQVNNALDALFARYASVEGPAYLWYAIRLQQLPLGLFGIAIAGALLPPLSRALKQQDLATSQHFFQFALRRSLALMLPITAAIFLLGDRGVQLIYGHGDFTLASTVETVKCLWGYGVGLVPMTLILVLAPAFYATEDYRTPAIASVIAMGLNVTLNTLLIVGLHAGAASVAWSTSVSALLNLLWLIYYLPRSLTFSWKALGLCSAKVLMATVAASTAVLFFPSNQTIAILMGRLPVYSASFLIQAGQLALQSSLFVGVLLATARFVGAEDLFRLFGPERKLQTQT